MDSDASLRVRAGTASSRQGRRSTTTRRRKLVNRRSNVPPSFLLDGIHEEPHSLAFEAQLQHGQDRDAVTNVADDLETSSALARGRRRIAPEEAVRRCVQKLSFVKLRKIK